MTILTKMTLFLYCFIDSVSDSVKIKAKKFESQNIEKSKLEGNYQGDKKIFKLLFLIKIQFIVFK